MPALEPEVGVQCDMAPARLWPSGDRPPSWRPLEEPRASGRCEVCTSSKRSTAWPCSAVDDRQAKAKGGPSLSVARQLLGSPLHEKLRRESTAGLLERRSLHRRQPTGVPLLFCVTGDNFGPNGAPHGVRGVRGRVGG